MVQEHHSLRGFAAAFIAATLLSACTLLAPHPPTSQPPTPQISSPQPQVSPPPLQSPSPPAPHAPPPARENHLSAATRSLVTQARSQVAHGDLPAASSTLDRALRIEPNNPLLWIELGRLRLPGGAAHQPAGGRPGGPARPRGGRLAPPPAGRLPADALRGP